MTRPARSRLDDPTAERTADPVSSSNRKADDEECVHRTGSDRCYTPRRYEQPIEKDRTITGNKSQ